MPVPGLSPELFPQALPALLLLQGPLAIVGWLRRVLHLPKAPVTRLQPCPRLGRFLCKSENRALHKHTGLMLSQAHGPAMSAPYVLFLDIFTSYRPQIWD